MITAKTRLWCLLNSPNYKSLNVMTRETSKYRIVYWCWCRGIFGLLETRKKTQHLLGDSSWKNIMTHGKIKDNTFYSCSFCFVNFCFFFLVNWFPGKFFFNSVFVIENINLHTNSTKKEYLVANRQLYWVSLQQSYEHWEFLRQKNQFFKAVQERIYSLAWNFCTVFLMFRANAYVFVV